MTINSDAYIPDRLLEFMDLRNFRRVKNYLMLKERDTISMIWSNNLFQNQNIRCFE